MTGKLHGKTIVVTGAARGLGALFCHAIADAGGTILALGRDEAALAAMIAGLSGTGHDLVLAWPMWPRLMRLEMDLPAASLMGL